MAKKENAEESEALDGEQLDLIDLEPENSKEIIQAARSYKKYQTQRIKAGNKEEEEKQKLRTLIKEAKLERLEDGKIKCRVKGMVITVTPRDELISVTEEKKIDIED